MSAHIASCIYVYLVAFHTEMRLARGADSNSRVKAVGYLTDISERGIHVIGNWLLLKFRLNLI